MKQAKGGARRPGGLGAPLLHQQASAAIAMNNDKNRRFQSGRINMSARPQQQQQQQCQLHVS